MNIFPSVCIFCLHILFRICVLCVVLYVFIFHIYAKTECMNISFNFTVMMICMKNTILNSYYEAQKAEQSFNSITNRNERKVSECKKFLCPTRHLCLVLILLLTSSAVIWRIESNSSYRVVQNITNDAAAVRANKMIKCVCFFHRSQWSSTEWRALCWWTSNDESEKVKNLRRIDALGGICSLRKHIKAPPCADSPILPSQDHSYNIQR